MTIGTLSDRPLDALDRLRAALLREDWPTVVAECERLQLVAMRAYLTITTAPVSSATARRYDLKGAAKYLGISPTQLRRYVNAGDLEHERYGRRYVFPHTALATFADAHKEHSG